MDNMKYKLPYPFSEAFKHNGSIDYKLVPGAKTNDHRIVEELGHEITQHYDCTYSASGLPGLSLSSYGDWGTIYGDACDEAKKLFLKMCEDNIITPWRIRVYKNGICYDYDGEWIKYDKDAGWIKCKSPYTK